MAAKKAAPEKAGGRRVGAALRLSCSQGLQLPQGV